MKAFGLTTEFRGIFVSETSVSEIARLLAYRRTCDLIPFKSFTFIPPCQTIEGNLESLLANSQLLS
jgi:hypothetical protein